MRTVATRERPAGLRYIETSAFLAALLEGDARAQDSLRADGVRATSHLTMTEARRAVVRARAGRRLTTAQERSALRAIAEFETQCDIVLVSDAIVRRTGRPFPVEPVRTLDAMHLASAESLDDSPQLVIVVTRDRRVRENAVAMGFDVE
jgi:predicted nucleic acid-binding protein